MDFKWDRATEDRLVSLWAGGAPLADIPRTLGAVGPDALTEHIQIMRAGGRWPEEADHRRQGRARRDPRPERSHQPLRAVAAIAKALGSLDAEGRYSVRVAAVRAEGGR